MEEKQTLGCFHITVAFYNVNNETNTELSITEILKRDDAFAAHYYINICSVNGPCVS